MNDATDEQEDALGVTSGDQPGEAPFLLADSPSHLLHRAQQYAAELFAELYDKHVTLRQFAVLAAVQGQAGGTQTDLVRATGIDRSTLAEMIARMEKKGLLAREKSNADGRAKSVRLTSRGRHRLAEAEPHARAADLAILEALPKPKRRALLDILQALTPAIDAAHTASEVEKTGKKKRKRNKKAKPAKTQTKVAPKVSKPKAPEPKVAVAEASTPANAAKPDRTRKSPKAKARDKSKT